MVSSWSQSIRDMNTSSSRPLILTIYATAIVGMFFSSFYVISSIYAGAPPAYTTSCSFSDPDPNSPHLDKASNSSLEPLRVEPRNPLRYLGRFPAADVLTSTDQVIPTVVDDSLELWQQGGTIEKLTDVPA